MVQILAASFLKYSSMASGSLPATIRKKAAPVPNDVEPTHLFVFTEIGRVQDSCPVARQHDQDKPAPAKIFADGFALDSPIGSFVPVLLSSITIQKYNGTQNPYPCSTL
ncbi:MAG: hypothetical protein HGA97_10375 [Chlorobiaceae bacterium]|nr:hypothetical protein [Chlorobiaceae bacterium]